MSNGNGNWRFPKGSFEITVGDHGKGPEQRVLIRLENNQTADVPLAGVKVIKDDETKEAVAVQVNCTRVRKMIRSAAAIG